MQTRTVRNTINRKSRRNKNISSRIHVSNSTRQSINGRKQKRTNLIQKFRISSIEIKKKDFFLNFITIKENEVFELIELFVSVLKYYDVDIDQIQLNKDDNVMVLLRELIGAVYQQGIDEIELLRNEQDKISLKLYKMVDYGKNVYCMDIGNVFCLKEKNKFLFNSVLQLVKETKFSSMFSEWDDIGATVIETFKSDIDQCDGFKIDSLKFYKENLKAYKSHLNDEQWIEKLEKYNPRKPIYKQIKELLLKSREINFSVMHQFDCPATYTSMHEFSDAFCITDGFETQYIRMYLEIVNMNANEGYWAEPYISATFSEEGFKGFGEYDKTLNSLNELYEYMKDFNEVLEKI